MRAIRRTWSIRSIQVRQAAYLLWPGVGPQNPVPGERKENMNIYICYRYDPGDKEPSWWRGAVIVAAESDEAAGRFLYRDGDRRFAWPSSKTTNNPEDRGDQVITHWMPLPQPPIDLLPRDEQAVDSPTEKEDGMKWRDKIRHELNRRGWTQRETAKRLGVSQAYLSMMLSGQRPLSPRIAVRLESVTGLIAWHLLFYQMQEDVALAYREETAWLNADLAETADE